MTKRNLATTSLVSVITIVDETGEPIDMGFTPFFKSDLQIYWQFIKMKVGSSVSNQQRKNRKLLSDVMQKAGFEPLSFEWWHFNGLAKNEAGKKYQIIEQFITKVYRPTAIAHLQVSSWSFLANESLTQIRVSGG